MHIPATIASLDGAAARTAEIQQQCAPTLFHIEEESK